ncbi:hypothetical protein BX616_006231 [Lobosporangium transversale]|nr:hypothetical protein BX616_006231 [Lobosporangium transversale]
MDNLLLTMRVLAWYYTISDIALISQVFYYRRTSVKGSFESVITHANSESLNMSHEHTPLIGSGNGIGGGSTTNYSSISPSEHVHENEHDRMIHQAAMAANTAASHYNESHDHTANGHHHQQHLRRRSSTHSTLTNGSGKLRSKAVKRRKMIRRAIIILFPLVLLALLIWLYHDWLQCTLGDEDGDGSHCGRGHNGGHGKLPPSHPPKENNGDPISFVTINNNIDGGHDEEGHEKTLFQIWVPLLLGWGSALLYLGSRIPQIYKNWRLKSCEGLSIMMFVFSVFGNVLYVASIFLFSIELDYLIRNLPWVLGSGGTLVFDFTIFFQFYKYRHNTPLSEALKEAAATGELDENALAAAAEEDEADNTTEDDESNNTTASSTLNKNKQRTATALNGSNV